MPTLNAISPATDVIKASEADIRYAYRLLLGREPDAVGLRDHLRWALENGATPANVAQHFIASHEYRNRQTSTAELVQVELNGYSVFPRRGDELIGAIVRRGEAYEPYVVEWFEKSLSPGACVLDIGANIGLYTMRAASRVGSTGRVIAVEPLPQNHKALYAGISHNGFSNVWVLPFAASEKAGLIPAICGPDSSNGIVGVRSSGTSLDDYVPTCRLDEVLSFVPKIDVVKIDIEGHEPSAWKGMTTLMRRHRPVVFTEFSPIAMRNVGQNANEYLGMLFDHASRVRVLHRDTVPVECADAHTVMVEWESANRRLGLNGELHLDLHIEPAARPY